MPLPSCICVAGRPPFDRLNDIFCALSQINPAPTGVMMDTITNFSVGTPGQLLTPAWMNAGTFGADWGAWVAAHNGDQPNEYSYVEDHPVQLPFELVVDGVSYNGSEGQGMTFDFSGSPASYDAWVRNLPAGFTSAVFVLLVQFQRIGGSANYNNDILSLNGANYTRAQHHYDPNPSIDKTIYCHSEGDLGKPIVDDGDWMIVWGRHNTEDDKGEIFSQNLSLDVLGSSQTEHIPPAGDLIYISLSAYLRSINQGTGFTKVKLLAFRNSSLAWPPYTITVPTSSGLTLLQTGIGQVLFSWTSTVQIVDIQRQINGGSWVTLAAEYGLLNQTTYTDTGRANGSSVKYRNRGVIGDQVSDWVESSSLVINDTPFLGGDAILTQTLGSNISVVDQRGFKFTVGATPITITEVGITLNAGMYSPTIAVKIYNMAGVELASAGVSTSGTPGTYNFATLGSPLSLSANTAYYCVTEALNFNVISDSATVATSVAPSITINDAVSGTAPVFTLNGAGANHAFVPTNFRWHYT